MSVEKLLSKEKKYLVAFSGGPDSVYLLLKLVSFFQERKENKIITENHLVTVNKRETSFEGLVSQFENGEDGIYNLMTKNKNIIFQPKKSITK